MSKEIETKSETFKKRFSDFFWWAPLPSLIADTIAIVNAVGIWWLDNFQTTQHALNPDPNFNPPVFPGIKLDDAVIITGWLTALIIATLFYVAYWTQDKSKKYSYFWVIAPFLSALLTFLYFRLWLGEKWWVLVCVIPITIVILAIFGIISGSVFGKISVEGNKTSISIGEIPALDSNNNQPYLLPTQNQIITPLPLPYYDGSYFSGESPQVNITTPTDVQTIIDAYLKNVPGGVEQSKLGLEEEGNKKANATPNWAELLLGTTQNEDDVMAQLRKTWGEDQAPKTNDDIMDLLRKAWGSDKNGDSKK